MFKKMLSFGLCQDTLVCMDRELQLVQDLPAELQDVVLSYISEDDYIFCKTSLSTCHFFKYLGLGGVIAYGIVSPCFILIGI